MRDDLVPLSEFQSSDLDRHAQTRVAACLELGRLAQNIAAAIREQLEQLTESVGLGETTFRLLWHLHLATKDEKIGIGQSDLASCLDISTAQVSGRVEALRKRGLIEGHRPADDRRKQVWRLTDQGIELVTSLAPTIDAWARQIIDRGRDADKVPLGVLLDRLHADPQDGSLSDSHRSTLPVTLSISMNERGAA